MKGNKLKFFILLIILIVISFITILINGKALTYKCSIGDSINNINDLNISIVQDKEVIKITDKKIIDDTLILNLVSINKGKAGILIKLDNYDVYETFYVHNFGIITQNNYFGHSNGDIIIPIAILLYISLLLISLIRKYKNSIKKNIYQYKNILYLGIIIFTFFMFLNGILELLNYNGLLSSINFLINSTQLFSIFLFPIALIASILVIISNIKLLRKEGFTWRNMLGIILGLLVIIATIIPSISYDLLQDSSIVDIHNQGAIDLYIYDFYETSIYIIVAYLESILLGTIILGIKAAKHIPDYNKDYIIILGCMIKKDETLTPLLKSRVDRAIEFSKLQKENTKKDIIFVPSGGKGSNEIISEAEAMKNYLLKQGIDKDRIIIENKSTNTFENINYSYKLIHAKNPNAQIAFSTTNYHVFRAGVIATNSNINIEGIGSKTKAYFWINAFIREFIATIYTE